MSALCCRAGDSPLVAASRVTLSVQLYAELGALGLVSAMLAGARPHPDERSGLAITALWLAVATGSVALGACVASLRGLRHGRAFPRFVAAAYRSGGLWFRSGTWRGFGSSSAAHLSTESRAALRQPGSPGTRHTRSILVRQAARTSGAAQTPGRDHTSPAATTAPGAAPGPRLQPNNI